MEQVNVVVCKIKQTAPTRETLEKACQLHLLELGMRQGLLSSHDDLNACCMTVIGLMTYCLHPEFDAGSCP